MKSLNTLFATLLLISAGSAFAASSVDLTVRGLITPSACKPDLSNGGNVDLGKISARDLNADKPTTLAGQSLQLSVTCDAQTLMALEAKDNRKGSAYIEQYDLFGLGLINSTEKLGAMEMRLINPVADGLAGRMIASEDGGLTWYYERYFTHDNILSVANIGIDAPLPVQLFTADMMISPIIAPASGLTLNNEVAIDGSVTLTVKYL